MVWLAPRLRVRIWSALDGDAKRGSAVRDLGCTVTELKARFEAMFYPHPITGEAMTWENHGLRGWHIDHIRPLDSFTLTDRQQFLEACHYTNLQPLWAKGNLEKSAKLPSPISSISQIAITNPDGVGVTEPTAPPPWPLLAQGA